LQSTPMKSSTDTSASEGMMGTHQYGKNIDHDEKQGVGATSGAASGEKVHSGGLKGALAGVHGVGEKIRGTFNAEVDKVAGEDSSKGVATAASGDREMQTGQFAASTKEREGVQGARHQQANTDLNRE